MKYSLLNKSKNKQVLDSVFYAISLIDRLKGLIPYKKLEKHEGMFLSNCTSIHTFFMSFSIDCYFLDRNNKVIEIKRNIKPYRISAPFSLRIKHVLEVEHIDGYQMEIDIGDELELQ